VVAGKTVNVRLKRGPELEKAQREVAGYERFRELVGQVTEVNEAICDARPVDGPAVDAGSTGEQADSEKDDMHAGPPQLRRTMSAIDRSVRRS
jgi:hypothetical protein